MTNTHGGRRPNSGRKVKYPGIETVRIVRTVPKEMVERIDELLLTFEQPSV